MVFTMLRELNTLASVHARWVCDTPMMCMGATLTKFTAKERRLGGIDTFTSTPDDKTLDRV